MPDLVIRIDGCLDHSQLGGWIDTDNLSAVSNKRELRPIVMSLIVKTKTFA